MKDRNHLPRVQHLRTAHEAALRRIARGQLLDGSDPFAMALAMDPTVKAVYLQVVIRWLLSSTVRFEDSERIVGILQRFHDNKHRLPIDRRDIGAYAAPGDIEDVLDGEDDGPLRDVPVEILSECQIVEMGNDWAIFRLLTPSAAQWWASSTSWCTKHVETAKRYLADGRLHVVVIGNKRFQYHAIDGQFMDARDRRVLSFEDFPPALLQAIDATIAEELACPAGAMRRVCAFEGRLNQALSLHGMQRMSLLGADWISGDGRVALLGGRPRDQEMDSASIESLVDQIAAITKGESVEEPGRLDMDGIRIELRRLHRPNASILIVSGGGCFAIDRERFVSPEGVPPMLLDLLCMDASGEKGDGAAWRDGIGQWVVESLWRDLEPSFMNTVLKLAFNDCIRIGGRSIALWSVSETSERPVIGMLDLAEGKVRMLRSREDVLSAPDVLRRALREHVKFKRHTSYLLASLYGEDIAFGTVAGIVGSLKFWIARLLRGFAKAVDA